MIDRYRGKDDTGTWGTDTMTFRGDELSRALGRQGGARKKHAAPVSDTALERRRA